MAIGLRLDLQQTQQLVMTPQLQQAIRLLQMSNVELLRFVESEIESNPLLTLVNDQPAPVEQPGGEPGVTAADESNDIAAATDARSEDHTLLGDTFDTGTENVVEQSPGDPSADLVSTRPGTRTLTGGGDDDRTIEETLADSVSLRDHLHAQIGQSGAGSLDTAIARLLIEELDADGYLRIDLEALGRTHEIDKAQVAAGLALLQECEPCGVAARSLSECFRLQLQDQGRYLPPLSDVADNLDSLASKGAARLARDLCLSQQDITNCLQSLRALDPWPCAAFSVSTAATVVPDVLLSREDWGGWTVTLNAEAMPRVALDRTYAARVRRGADGDAVSYLQTCRSNAAWLSRSLEQRATTILKVATEIVRQQEAFFEQGIGALKPLVLRDVADAVGAHESTVSRVTSGKYMATDRGTFELKFFFSNGVGREGSTTAAEAVRHRIREMIAAETADAVLSDDDIVLALRRDGVEIARRTAAKYRKSMKIPSSAQRRRSFAIRSG